MEKTFGNLSLVVVSLLYVLRTRLQFSPLPPPPPPPPPGALILFLPPPFKMTATIGS